MDSSPFFVFTFGFGWSRHGVILRSCYWSWINVRIDRSSNCLPSLSRSWPWLTVCWFISWLAIIARCPKSTRWRSRIPINLILCAHGRSPHFLIWMWSESCSLSVEVLWGRSLLLERAIATSHTVAVVVSCFDRASHVGEVLRGVLLALLLLLLLLLHLRVAQAWGAWWLSNFHPGTESIFQENASILWSTCILGRSSLLVTNSATWRNRMMVIAVVRWNNFVALEVVGWDPLSLRVFLSSSGSWVEEVVHWLESSTTLTWNLLIFVCKRIL